MSQRPRRCLRDLRRRVVPSLPLSLSLLLSVASGLVASASPGPAAAAETGPAGRPSIVLILVDDLGWADLSCQGSRYHETPNLDRLAGEGIRFTDAYAACAVCSPTRAALMTGRYPARVGVTDWIRARFQRGKVGTPERNPTEYVAEPGRKLLCPPNPYWMELEEVTIAEALRPLGYATCHIGKWHLGDDAWYPQHQGFDVNLGGCDYGQPPSYFDPYRNPGIPQGIPGLEPRREGEYLTDREADEAVRFIREHRDRPFFLYLAHYAVHTPLQAKAELVAKYKAKPPTSQKNAVYAAMVQSMDEAAGKVIAAIDETGIAERTLVVFTSDNGGLLGPTDNSPLRSGKGNPWEGGIRVPVIARWKGRIPAGAVSSEPVSSIDWLPTILEAAGAPLPEGREIDGTSILRHLESGGKAPLEPRSLVWHFPHYRGSLPPWSAIRSGPWKLIRWHEGPTRELYHLGDDPRETNDLSGAEPERARELDAELTTRLEAMGARLPRAAVASGPMAEETTLKETGAKGRPRVLILGDSISIGYTPFVREILRDEAVVVRPTTADGKPENCDGTTKGVRALDRWLALDGGRWSVIHFNFGLHDLKRVDPATGANSNDPSKPRQAEPEVYERQLREIVARLEKTGARLVVATTTPVPPGGVRPHRDPADPERYNEIARRVVAGKGIAIDDLHGFIEPRLGELQEPVNVHFTEEGYRALAGRVAESIREALR